MYTNFNQGYFNGGTLEYRCRYGGCLRSAAPISAPDGDYFTSPNTRNVRELKFHWRVLRADGEEITQPGMLGTDTMHHNGSVVMVYSAMTPCI
jgi:hypothetical protein